MLVFRSVLMAGLCLSQQVLAGPIPQASPDQISPFMRTQTDGPSFETWLMGLRERALVAGISGDTFDGAVAGITYNDTIIDRDRNQSEFSKALWDYLDTAVSDARIRNGRAAFSANRATLNRIEAAYGVDAPIIVAIWGLESAYGAVRGSTNIIEAMATLAYDSRRSGFFESQLIAALQILQAGETVPQNMVGSWAGAMGHTQFMPTSYQDYAVDGNSDGRRDIWGDDPVDALASTANYLAEFGWTQGQPWGVEVHLPEAFDYATARRENTQLPSQWAAAGVLGTNGNPVPDHGPASILLPGGADGAAFMIFDNFAVLEEYNTADAYVIGVGHLADRIAGGDPIQAPWPRGDRALTGDERRELQRRLTAAGYDTTVDGRIGPLTINSVRAYQLANGLVPDGYVSLRLLNGLR